MRILLTGTTGFIGQHLLRKLALRHETAALVRQNYKKDRLQSITPTPKLLIWDGTVESMQTLMESFKPECVMHLACCFVGSCHKATDLDLMIESNIRFPSLLVDAMVKAGCGNFISTGSIAQHCNNAAYAPLNYFAASKQAFADILTYYVQVGGLRRAITLELSDTFGADDPRSKLIHLLQKASASGEPLGMSPGQQYVDFVHVDDVVKAYEQALALLMKLPDGEQRVYAVRSNRPMTVQAFVALYNSVSARPAKIEWGKRDYHGPEFLTPWQQGEMLPDWKAEIDIRKELASLINHA